MAIEDWDERCEDMMSTSCFICLGDNSYSPLVSCCSQCFARVHDICWHEWRTSQRLSFLRARIIGQAPPSIKTCSICKTGNASTKKDKDAKEWSDSNPEEREKIQDLLLQAVGRIITGTEDTVFWPTFFSGRVMLINFCLIISASLCTGIMITSLVLKVGTAMLLATFFMYEILAAEVIVLIIVARRKSLKSFLDSLWSTEDGIPIEESLESSALVNGAAIASRAIGTTV